MVSPVVTLIDILTLVLRAAHLGEQYDIVFSFMLSRIELRLQHPLRIQGPSTDISSLIPTSILPQHTALHSLQGLRPAAQLLALSQHRSVPSCNSRQPTKVESRINTARSVPILLHPLRCTYLPASHPCAQNIRIALDSGRRFPSLGKELSLCVGCTGLEREVTMDDFSRV
jgi:hypothetical protein